MAILTTSDLANTTIIYLHQSRIRSQIIYSVTLLAVIVALASLPFIYTTVSVKGSGMMQSKLEKTELFAPTTGHIVRANLKDNQKIKAGDTLLIIDTALPKQQADLTNNRARQLKQHLADIHILTQGLSSVSIPNKLATPLYVASWQQHVVQLANAQNATTQASRIFQRYKTLYDKKVVSLAEFEQYKYNHEQALSNQQLIIDQYKAKLQADASQYHSELKTLGEQSIQLQEQKRQYLLKATVSGSLQNLTGVQAGTLVYANQKLGEISPDSLLLAYCYIKPADIGLIKKGQRVRIQVDAFNYNQWGMLTGKVVDIADDIVIREQAPYFKVKCQLNRNYLQLKNGYRGEIKKGMTFRANFTIAKRSLYQLLYDKVDDWLNPAR